MHLVAKILLLWFAATCMLGTGTILLIEYRLHGIIDWALDPVISVLKSLVPTEWQFLGNVPLGLGLLFLSVAIYALMATTAIFALGSFIRYLRSRLTIRCS
jgi:hypothetical protein